MKKWSKLLVVCSGNVQRSPTFELWVKKNRPYYEVKSTGIYYGYPERLTEELLKWADIIFLMDLEQEMFFESKFPQFLYKTEIVGCIDRYDRESPQLYKLIEYWANKRGL